MFCLTCFIEEELGSSEEEGKDWSDLEREAAEEDKERGEDRFRDDYNSSKKKKSNRRQSPSPSKDRYVYACINAYSIFDAIYIYFVSDIILSTRTPRTQRAKAHPVIRIDDRRTNTGK